MTLQWQRYGQSKWYDLEMGATVSMNGNFEFREKPAFEPHWRMNPDDKNEAYLIPRESYLKDYEDWIPVTVTPIED